MNYLIEILFVLSTIVVITFESRQGRTKNSLIHNQQQSIYSSTYSEDSSQGYGSSYLKDDPKYATESQNYEEKSSKWYPMQRYTLQTPILQSDHHISSEKEDVLDRDSISITRTQRTQRKHKGYTSTRFTNEKGFKYEKDTDIDNVDRDRVDHKQKNKRRQSKIRTQKKNNEIDPIGLYINVSHQILYNNTHYAPYLNQLFGNYDINYLWSKQKFAKEFDESFKIPPSSLNRQLFKPLSREIARNSNKTTLPTKLSKGPLALVFHGPTMQTNSFIKNTIKKENKGIIRLGDLQKKSHQYNILMLLDSKMRQLLSNVMALLNYKNFKEEVPIVENNFGRYGHTPLGIKEWIDDIGKKTKDKLTDFFQNDVVNNFNKITVVKDEVKKFVNKTVGTVKHEVQKLFGLEPVKIKNESETIKSGNASARNKNFDQWRPWIHRVEDDVKVNSFIKNILDHKLKLFTAIGNKAKDRKWKKKIKDLARIFKDKFTEYIVETSQHNVRTKMGTERVVLNSIDVSNSIVKRLINFVTKKADRKGSLRYNNELLSLFDKELKKETNEELKRACSKLNVCRSSNGMSSFLADMVTKIDGLKNDEFKLVFKNLAETIQAVDYSDVLNENTSKGIQETMKRYEKMPLLFQKAAMSAIKNILTNVNKPFVMYNDIIVGQLDKTLAAFEIIKILDEKVPNSVDNINTWNSIKSKDITNPDTIVEFVVHVKRMLANLDGEARSRLLKQCNIIYS